jgi:hypothetical protein
LGGEWEKSIFKGKMGFFPFLIGWEGQKMGEGKKIPSGFEAKKRKKGQKRGVTGRTEKCIFRCNFGRFELSQFR